MKIAVLSDVHANLAAFEAVLRHAEKCQVEEFWCLGDLIGRGPQAAECVRLGMQTFTRWSVGNHEIYWNLLLGWEEAQEARFTRGSIDEQVPIAKAWLEMRTGTIINQSIAVRTLIENILGMRRDNCLDGYRILIQQHIEQPTHFVERNGLLFAHVHASLREPFYQNCFSAEDAKGDQISPLAMTKNGYCGGAVFYGHTHFPLVFYQHQNQVVSRPFDYRTRYSLKDTLAAVNVGSVGHPGDEDPRACYVVLDTSAGEFSFQRVPYDTTSLRVLAVNGRMKNEMFEVITTARFRTSEDRFTPEQLTDMRRRKAIPDEECSDVC